MTQTRTLRFNANREKGRNDEQEFNTRLNDFKYERELEYIRQIKELYGDIEVNAVYCNFDVGYGDVLTLPNSFLVCCYQPGSIRCYELKYDVFNYR